MYIDIQHTYTISGGVYGRQHSAKAPQLDPLQALVQIDHLHLSVLAPHHFSVLDSINAYNCPLNAVIYIF